MSEDAFRERKEIRALVRSFADRQPEAIADRIMDIVQAINKRGCMEEYCSDHPEMVWNE